MNIVISVLSSTPNGFFLNQLMHHFSLCERWVPWWERHIRKDNHAQLLRLFNFSQPPQNTRKVSFTLGRISHIQARCGAGGSEKQLLRLAVVGPRSSEIDR